MDVWLLMLVFVLICIIWYHIGWTWTYKYVFVEKGVGGQSKTTSASTLEELSLGDQEDIKTVYLHKHPLFSWQLTQQVLCHEFIVFNTDTWWWSIEKNSTEILIQRSKISSDVQDYNRSGPRTTSPGSGIEVKEWATGSKSITELIEILCRRHEAYNPYDILLNNCKVFAQPLFKYLVA